MFPALQASQFTRRERGEERRGEERRGGLTRPRTDALTPLNAARTRASDPPELCGIFCFLEKWRISAFHFLPFYASVGIALGFKVGFLFFSFFFLLLNPDAGNWEIPPLSLVDDTSTADCRVRWIFPRTTLSAAEPAATRRFYACIWNKWTPVAGQPAEGSAVNSPGETRVCVCVCLDGRKSCAAGSTSRHLLY